MADIEMLSQNVTAPALSLGDERPVTPANIAMCCFWFLMIALMFFAQHHVCDAYFVPAINVFVTKMRGSTMKCAHRWGEEAVAGATICALGCNGPELFCNLISLYTCSDAGIGVVVGSEIFNLLIIVGCATLAAPSLIVFERAPFTRDCFFYALSIFLLYTFMLDKTITFQESLILLGAAVVYVASVYFTTDVVNCFSKGSDADTNAAAVGGGKKAKMHGVEVEVKEVLHSRQADGSAANIHLNMKPTEMGIVANQGPTPKANARGSVGIQMDNPDALLGSMLRYDYLREVAVVSEGSMRLEFKDGATKHVTLIVTCPDEKSRKSLLDEIKIHDNIVWVHDYDSTVVGAIKEFYHKITDKKATIGEKLMSIPEFLIDFFLKSTLFFCDVKDIHKENLWPVCFAGSMCWLAIFSFAMLEIANFINYNIPAIPVAFLGITVCAIGTSFPNAVASIIMATQGKSAAAIANALGSNIQNVFLAMACPWVIFQLFPGTNCEVYDGGKGPTEDAVQYGAIAQNAAGLTEGILWMIGTLALMILFVFLPPLCSLSRTYGMILMGVYCVYLGLTTAETFMGFTLVPN